LLTRPAETWIATAVVLVPVVAVKPSLTFVCIHPPQSASSNCVDGAGENVALMAVPAPAGFELNVTPAMLVPPTMTAERTRHLRPGVAGNALAPSFVKNVASVVLAATFAKPIWTDLSSI
jgi:hypothetical protein